MTDNDTPRNRATVAVREILAERLREPADAGYTITVPVGEIVDAVIDAYGDASLRLPRYYPQDDGQPWLLGVGRTIDPDTGKPKHLYARWWTGLTPSGRVRVEIVEADTAEDVTLGRCLDLAEFLAAPDSLPHVLRMVIAGCDHAVAHSGERSA